MKEYRVQAILIDNTGRYPIETVTDSVRSTNWMKTLEFFMKRHNASSSYLYIVQDIETQENILKTKDNLFAIPY